MILLGALTAAPTALTGIYAMWDVNNPGAAMNVSTWADARASSPIQGDAWEHLEHHAWFNGCGAIAVLLLVVVWLGLSDDWRRKMHLPLQAVLLACVIVLVWGAWHGGEMVYRHGVAVEQHASEAGVAEADEDHHHMASEDKSTQEKIEYFVPPMQLHVVLAGTAIALGLAAIGLSLRQTTRIAPVVEPRREVEAMSAAFEPQSLRRDVAEEPVLEYASAPASRFWLLAALAAVCTALVGAWILGTLDPKRIWDQISNRTDSPTITRQMAHVIMGVSIVVLMLLLALFSRFASRKRILLGIFVLLLVIAVGSQVWLGTLLLLDSPDGTITSFNPPSEESHQKTKSPHAAATTHAGTISITTRPTTR
jgi:hypothetical protein